MDLKGLPNKFKDILENWVVTDGYPLVKNILNRYLFDMVREYYHKNNR